MPSAIDAYANFRRRLRAARQAAGLTQVQAAARLGKPQSYVSKCESGERRVDVVELGAFARAYGVSARSFIGDLERPLRAVAEPPRGYRPGKPAKRRRSDGG